MLTLASAISSADLDGSAASSRMWTSSLSALSDPRFVARAVHDAVAGSGVRRRHLEDPDVEGIWNNERLTAG